MAVLRGGRFTGGNFRPTPVQITEDAQTEASTAPQPTQSDTIAPSGQGRLPSHQTSQGPTSNQSAPQPERPRPQEQSTSGPESARPGASIVSIADQVFASGGPSTSTSAAARPKIFGGGVDVDKETAGINVSLEDGLTTDLRTRTEHQQTQGRTGARSPERADVVTQPVPKAGAVIGEKHQQFETAAEVNARYEQEQARQRENVKGANRLAKAAQTNLSDSEATVFESASYNIAQDLSVYATKDPAVSRALTDAGLVKDGVADLNASRTLFYLLSKKVAENDNAKNKTAATISRDISEGTLDKSEIDEKFYNAQKTDHYLRPKDFSGAIGRELSTMLGIDNALDVDNRIENTDALRGQGDERGQSILSAITPKLLENIGAITPKEITNSDGKVETVYEVDVEFERLAKNAAGQLSEFSPQFARDVTFTPNIGGVPSGVAGVAHKETTKSATSKTRVEKGSEVWEAINAMGTTPNGVDQTHLKGLMAMLNDIKKWRDADTERDPLTKAFSFSRHPSAEAFKLGETTWMKGFKITRDVYTEQTRYKSDSGFQLKVLKELFQISKFSDELGAVDVNGVPYQTGLIQVYRSAQKKISGGIDVERNQYLISQLQEMIESANYQQGTLAQADLKALADGARLNGKTFYHTYTPHAATSRPMVASTKFNPQSNKVARGLHANPRIAVVDIRAGKPDNAVATAWKAIIARTLAENGEHATGIKQLAGMFKDITDRNSPEFKSYEDVRKVAVAYYLSHKENTVDMAALASNFNNSINEASYGVKSLLPNSGKAYIDTGLSLNMDQEMTKLMAKVLKTSKGGVQVKSDELHLRMKALHDLGKYLESSDGGLKDVAFQTQISAEADGISNGLIIQARQFGNDSVLRKGGVLYAIDENGNEIVGFDNILPDGDMRQHIHTTLTTTALETMFPNETERSKWRDAYRTMFMPDGVNLDEDRVKALHKVPVMTTPYGLDPENHGASVKAFTELPDMQADFETAVSNMEITPEEFIETMKKLEGVALTTGLGAIIKHQAVVKNATNAAIAAGKLFVVKGANGWPVVSGGFVHNNEADFGSVNIGDSEVKIVGNRTFGTSLANKKYQDENDPAARKSGLKLINEFESSGADTTTRSDLMREIEKVSELGTATRNQSAVAGTQNIDATIVQQGFLDSKNKVGDDFWGMQIFDAVIGDVHSYAAMVDTINEKFDSVNNNYSMVDAEIDAVRNIRQEVLKDVKIAKQNNLKFDVSPTGAYAGMYNVIEKLVVKKWRAHNKDVAIGKPQKGAKQSLSNVLTAPKFGWKQGGSLMSPSQFLETYDFIIKELEIMDSLKRLKADVDRGRAEAKTKQSKQALLGARTRQYS